MLRFPRKLTSLLCVLVMQFIFILNAFAAPPVATLQTANGSVTVRRTGAANFVALGANASLLQGDEVRTGANSKATLLFANGSQVRLNAKSSIVITPPVAVGRGKQSLFRVLSGEVLSRLRPGQAVQTRNAIAGVRGTVLHLKIDPDDSTTLTVVEGEVEFFNEFGAVIVGTVSAKHCAGG